MFSIFILIVNNQRPSMGKHILTATNITNNPMNHSVAEYACVDIQCIGSNTLNATETEINHQQQRSIYERLQLQPHEQQQQKQQNHTTKQTSKTSNNTSNINKTTTCKINTNNMNHQRQPPSYNLGNYFPRVSSEPTSRKNYQTSSRERDLKVRKKIQLNLNFSFSLLSFLFAFYSKRRK